MAGSTLSPTEALRWRRVGALAALALLLGYLESFIPLPLPGVKLGLANIPILVALDEHDLRGACWVAAVKVCATSLLFGNPVTLAYAATGTTLALACMAPLSLLPTMRLEMVSVVGALAHEAGQLLVAQVLLGTPLVWYGAPPLAVAGCATGLLCGLVAARTARLLREDPSQGLAPATTAPAVEAPHALGAESSDLPGDGLMALACYGAAIVILMHADTLPVLGACQAACVLACLAAQVPTRTAWRALAPTIPLALVALIAQVASAPHDAVIAQLGPLVLTHAALRAAAVTLARLVSVTLASVAFVTHLGRARLVRLAERLARPVEMLGFSLEGPRLALATTIDLLPLLAGDLWQEVGPRDLLTRDFWTRQLPTLVQGLYGQAVRSGTSGDERKHEASQQA